MSNKFIQHLNSEIRNYLLESDKLRSFVNSFVANSPIELFVLSFVKNHVDILTADLLLLTDILFEIENMDNEQGIIDLLNQMSLDNESPIE